jgi:SAM-dependent methyltransferase
MGAGQGWASVLVKQAYPTCYVVASDLVPISVAGSKYFEQQLQAPLDEKWGFNSRDIPFENEQFDRIFTMAAFHHFSDRGDFGKALEEMLRILKPGGQIKLLYEPSAPRYLYGLEMMRVNRRTDDVDEDVLVIKNIKSLESKLSCKVSYQYFPYAHHRDSLVSTIYYFGLSKVKFLAPFLPCTTNVTIRK